MISIEFNLFGFIYEENPIQFLIGIFRHYFNSRIAQGILVFLNWAKKFEIPVLDPDLESLLRHTPSRISHLPCHMWSVRACMEYALICSINWIIKNSKYSDECINGRINCH